MLTCLCVDGWSGPTCAVTPDVCDPNPCQNGATCSPNGDSGTVMCTCTEGWNGPVCAQADNPCDENPSPCLNGGTCNPGEGPGTFTCECTDGFTGEDCGTATQVSIRFLGETCGYVFGIGFVGNCDTGLSCECVNFCANPNIADAPSTCVGGHEIASTTTTTAKPIGLTSIHFYRLHMNFLLNNAMPVASNNVQFLNENQCAAAVVRNSQCDVHFYYNAVLKQCRCSANWQVGEYEREDYEHPMWTLFRIAKVDPGTPHGEEMEEEFLIHGNSGIENGAEHEILDIEQTARAAGISRNILIYVDNLHVNHQGMRIHYQLTSANPIIRWYWVLTRLHFPHHVDHTRWGQMKACQNCHGGVLVRDKLRRYINVHFEAPGLRTGIYYLWIVVERAQNQFASELYMYNYHHIPVYVGEALQFFMVAYMREFREEAYRFPNTVGNPNMDVHACAELTKSHFFCGHYFTYHPLSKACVCHQHGGESMKDLHELQHHGEMLELVDADEAGGLGTITYKIANRHWHNPELEELEMEGGMFGPGAFEAEGMWRREAHEVEEEMAEMEQALFQQHTLTPMQAQIDKQSISNTMLGLIYHFRQGQIPDGHFIRLHYVIARRPFTLGIEDVRYGHFKACHSCWGEISINSTRVLQSHLRYRLNNGKYRLWLAAERAAHPRSSELYMIHRQGIGFWIGPMTFQKMYVGKMCEDDQVAIGAHGTSASCAVAAASHWRCGPFFFMMGPQCTCAQSPVCDLQGANPLTAVYRYAIEPSKHPFPVYRDPFFMHEREEREGGVGYVHFPGEHWGEEPEHPEFELPDFEIEHEMKYGGDSGLPGSMPGFGNGGIPIPRPGGFHGVVPHPGFHEEFDHAETFGDKGEIEHEGGMPHAGVHPGGFHPGMVPGGHTGAGVHPGFLPIHGEIEHEGVHPIYGEFEHEAEGGFHPGMVPGSGHTGTGVHSGVLPIHGEVEHEGGFHPGINFNSGFLHPGFLPFANTGFRPGVLPITGEYEHPEYEGEGIFNPAQGAKIPGRTVPVVEGGVATGPVDNRFPQMEMGGHGGYGFEAEFELPEFEMPEYESPYKAKLSKTAEEKASDDESERKSSFPVIAAGFAVGIVVAVVAIMLHRRFTKKQEEPYLLDEYRDVESIEMDH